jgi:hypothetical protein
VIDGSFSHTPLLWELLRIGKNSYKSVTCPFRAPADQQAQRPPLFQILQVASAVKQRSGVNAEPLAPAAALYELGMVASASFEYALALLLLSTAVTT